MRHGTCFRRRLSARRAGAAPHSAVAELGVVRRRYPHSMNGRLIPLLFVALLALPAASNAAETLPPDIIAAFRSATRVLLYSLDPANRREGTGFHAFRIVGYTTVEDPATRQYIATTLPKHVQASNLGAMCFIPHHGIRLVSGRTIHDLVICYECGHVYIYSSGRDVRYVGISGDPAYLDKILTRAKVPLVPRNR